MPNRQKEIYRARDSVRGLSGRSRESNNAAFLRPRDLIDSIDRAGPSDGFQTRARCCYRCCRRPRDKERLYYIFNELTRRAARAGRGGSRVRRVRLCKAGLDDEHSGLIFS